MRAVGYLRTLVERVTCPYAYLVTDLAAACASGTVPFASLQPCFLEVRAVPGGSGDLNFWTRVSSVGQGSWGGCVPVPRASKMHKLN